MGVKLQSSLGGNVELNPPSTASNYTLTVPASNGTVAITDQLNGFRNRIINGDMRVMQRNLPYTGSDGLSNYGPDRFAMPIAGAGGTVTVARGTMVHNGITKYTCKFTVLTTPTSTTGTNRWEGITQYIEGFNFQDLVGQPLTVSFLFRSNITGKYTIRLGNGNAGYLTSFNYSTANAIQYVSITTPAMPDMVNFGNSLADNGNYMRVQIGYYNTATLAGSETANWSNPAPFSATGSANWTNAIGNFIELTELQVEAGTVATPFERRSYGTELALCQRYYIRSTSSRIICQQAYDNRGSDQAYGSVQFKQTMRAVPTVLSATFTSGTFLSWNSGSDSTVIWSQGSTQAGSVEITAYEVSSEL